MSPRIFMVVIALAFLPTLAQAGGTYGVKLGLASSELTGDVSAEPRSALTAGVFLAAEAYPFLDVVVEALYMPRGAEDVLTGRTHGALGPATDILTNARYHYLEVPFLLRVHPEGSGLHVLLGPSLAIKLGEDLSLARDYPPELTPWDFIRSGPDYSAYGVYGTLPAVDPSICVGAGYGRDVMGTHLGLDARAYFGLRNLTKYGRTVRNRSLTVSMVLGF